MNFSAVILAGGKSSRMGRDKAFLEIGGRTLLARQIEIARAAGAGEVFISGRADTDYSAFSARVVRDHLAGAGPLAGIHAALSCAAAPLLLVLAVDLPNVPAEWVRQLKSETQTGGGAIPRWAAHIEPLAAFYPTAALPVCFAMFQRQLFTVSTFAAHCVAGGLARWVDQPAAVSHYFANYNTPEDARLLTHP